MVFCPSGRSAGDHPGADRFGVADGHGHAAILERAGWVVPLVLDCELAGTQPGVVGQALVAVEGIVPFVTGDDRAGRNRRQELAESPDARFRLNRAALRDEIGWGQALAEVDVGVEQPATSRADAQGSVPGVDGATLHA